MPDLPGRTTTPGVCICGHSRKEHDDDGCTAPADNRLCAGPCDEGRSATPDEREALRQEVEAMRGYKPCRCGRTGRWAHKPDDRCLTAPARTTTAPPSASGTYPLLPNPATTPTEGT